jgi:hypothetical protein
MIIGLTGFKQSGKSTVADVLVRNGFIKYPFAKPGKNMLRAIGLTDAQLDGDQKEVPCALLAGKTPRYAMQTLMTEWARNMMDDDFWVRIWEREVRSRMPARIVCDDVRFENEARCVHKLGGALWRIVRPSVSAQGAHESERYAAQLACDVEIVEEDIDALRKNAALLLRDMLDDEQRRMP